VRRAWPALIIVALLAPSCAGTERPEGVVERWLVSLNQGAAGRPGRYAPESVSASVVPGWHELDPGELDVIAVGDARPGPGGTSLVPIQVEHVDGTVARTFAVVDRRQGSLRIVRLEPPPDTGPGLDPGFARASSSAVPAFAWFTALGVATLLILLTVGLMRLAPEPRPQTGSSR
jgi:hypothetical protein